MQTFVVADAQFRDGKNGTFLQVKDADGNLYFVFDTHLHNDLVAAIGQSVTVEVEQREMGRRITAVQSPAQTTYVAKPNPTDREAVIIREVAIKAAVDAHDVCFGEGTDRDAVIASIIYVAYRFERWITEGNPF